MPVKNIWTPKKLKFLEKMILKRASIYSTSFNARESDLPNADQVYIL